MSEEAERERFLKAFDRLEIAAKRSGLLTAAEDAATVNAYLKKLDSRIKYLRDEIKVSTDADKWYTAVVRDSTAKIKRLEKEASDLRATLEWSILPPEERGTVNTALRLILENTELRKQYAIAKAACEELLAKYTPIVEELEKNSIG